MKHLLVLLFLGLALIGFDVSAAPKTVVKTKGPPPTTLVSPPVSPTPAPAVNSAVPQTLKSAYLAALKRSETVDIQHEILTQVEENTTQAKGAFWPTISGSGNWTHQHLPNATANPGVPNSGDDQRTTKITGDLPLFRGFKEYATLKQRKFLVTAQVETLKNAAKQLFYDLAQAYYNVLALQADELNYKNEIEVNQKRLGELRHFLKIGRSRDTELLTFQANISALEAQLENTHGQLESAKDVLAFFTGWNRETPLQDSEEVAQPGTVEEYLKHIEDRPDVKSAMAGAQASNEGVPIAKGGHWPSLDLLGNSYFDRPGQPSNESDWDVQLVLTVPLFEGGIVQSQVRQAKSVAHQSELVLSQTRRLAEQEIRTLHSLYSADQKQVAKLDETVGWSKKNYEAELRDYRNGLVTNLDVLQAINTYQDSQRLLDRQRFNVRLDGVKLQAATGQRPEVNVDVEEK